jgi:hypothetical protein
MGSTRVGRISLRNAPYENISIFIQSHQNSTYRKIMREVLVITAKRRPIA